MVELRNFISVFTVELGSVVVVILLVAGLFYKYRQWIRVVPRSLFKDASKHLGVGGVLSRLVSELVNGVALQKNVITDSKVRWLTHFVVFWGFIGLAFATTWVFIFYGDGTPRPLTDLGKVVGNIGGALVIIGTTVILLRNAFVGKYKRGRRGDIIFFIVLYLATITGFTTQFARMAGGEQLAYANYAIHLILVLGLLVTAPFTHFLHAVLVPFMRFVERVHMSLLAKGVSTYADYRQMAISELAEHVSPYSTKEGKVPPTYPEWLKSSKTSKKQ